MQPDAARTWPAHMALPTSALFSLRGCAVHALVSVLHWLLVHSLHLLSNNSRLRSSAIVLRTSICRSALCVSSCVPEYGFTSALGRQLPSNSEWCLKLCEGRLQPLAEVLLGSWVIGARPPVSCAPQPLGTTSAEPVHFQRGSLVLCSGVQSRSAPSGSTPSSIPSQSTSR